ncbi:protein LIKE EARLY STARVATION, chloroplastic [Rutidosis leptorrhynchoides]|uniref:protein LIKE EARLY STARVATION, chloroplastic n=1 Tax=Rutidosis leptorrhynchoides TaxID=125765 RepID=UPI003A9916B0
MSSQFYITFTPSSYSSYPKPHHRFAQTHHPNRHFLLLSKRFGNGTVRVSDVGGDSYLGMWKKAMDRDRKEIEFNKIAKNVAGNDEDLEVKSSEFLKILDVDKEERDRIQRIQVIDRAAAAIAVASTLLNEEEKKKMMNAEDETYDLDDDDGGDGDGEDVLVTDLVQGSSESIGTPGPSFWSWIPPTDIVSNVSSGPDITPSRKTSPSPIQPRPLMEVEPSISHLSLPFESKTDVNHNPPLPPLQSLMGVQKQDEAKSISELREEQEVDNMFSTYAEDAAHALAEVDPVASSHGIKQEGSMWWKETGTDVRPDGVVCRWTLTRGVSADKSVEWEEKYWEAADELGYKELGSEKSGRDAYGNVWREFWKESMAQIEGCMHIEKTADKWGKNGKGDEWQEKWFEHYGAGQAEKWAHKWCTIDPTTQLDVGHAHVWHERWGEKYDGQGGSVKYTDKWAERSEGDRWTKWGDKWDEHFDQNGHGVKQGETWWEGKYGERWNKTWGEGHNGTGWVHKYGKSSSGEHWDTHVRQDTWYEKFPHYDFYHCYQNSVPLREVKKPSDRDSL